MKNCDIIINGECDLEYFTHMVEYINLITNNTFNLPKKEAQKLIDDSPSEFALVKNKKIIKKVTHQDTSNSVLKMILDE